MSKLLFALLPLAFACQDPPAPAEPASAAPAPAAEIHAVHEDGTHGEMVAGRSFANAEQWAKLFDDPGRDAWQKPVELVAALELAPGMTVADIGAGTGYLEGHLAAAVGAEGRVIAIDSEPAMVEYMKARVQ